MVAMATFDLLILFCYTAITIIHYTVLTKYNCTYMLGNYDVTRNSTCLRLAGKQTASSKYICMLQKLGEYTNTD